MALNWILLGCALIGLISSTVYLFLVVKAARRFRSRPRESTAMAPLPFVSVFKPLRGLEPFLERNLESFFQQDYPDFELIFGVRHETDPALAIVRALQSRYPHVKVKIV